MDVNERAGFCCHLICLIKEGHIRHRAGLRFSVHRHPMPEGKSNRFVITMTDSTTDINFWIAPHYLPTPTASIGISLQYGTIFIGCDAVWMPPADMNRLAPFAEELFDHVRLVAPATQSLISQNKFFIHGQCGLGHEKPLALTAKCAILAAVTLTAGNSVPNESVMHDLRLQSVHCLAHSRCASWHGRDKPLALVVSA